MNYNFYSLELMARDVQNDRQREAAGQQRYLKAVKALRTKPRPGPDKAMNEWLNTNEK